MKKQKKAEINVFFEMYKKEKENESNSFRTSDGCGLAESETKGISNSRIDNRKSTCGRLENKDA
jgi:3-deoxy-D-manno-octulosonate 8-phosphate phosphatase KdsC-like HAD superfamily phosphatase